MKTHIENWLNQYGKGITFHSKHFLKPELFAIINRAFLEQSMLRVGMSTDIDALKTMHFNAFIATLELYKLVMSNTNLALFISQYVIPNRANSFDSFLKSVLQYVIYEKCTTNQACIIAIGVSSKNEWQQYSKPIN